MAGCGKERKERIFAGGKTKKKKREIGRCIGELPFALESANSDMRKGSIVNGRPLDPPSLP